MIRLRLAALRFRFGAVFLAALRLACARFFMNEVYARFSVGRSFMLFASVGYCLALVGA
jgi:hypothetical protein